MIATASRDVGHCCLPSIGITFFSRAFMTGLRPKASGARRKGHEKVLTGRATRLGILGGRSTLLGPGNRIFPVGQRLRRSLRLPGGSENRGCATSKERRRDEQLRALHNKLENPGGEDRRSQTSRQPAGRIDHENE